VLNFGYSPTIQQPITPYANPRNEKAREKIPGRNAQLQRAIFSHPDFTVGYGISPYQSAACLFNAATESRALTAGREFPWQHKYHKSPCPEDYYT
jgi:hypothetical protein